jgi:hypothetical protein
MVRFLKVKDLEERRRLLVTQSELYRQTLRLEIVGLKFAAAEFKERFSIFNSIRRMLGVGVSVAALFRRQTRSGKGGGFVSRLFSGLSFAAEFMPILKNFVRSSPEAEKPDEPTDTTAPR